MRSNGLSAFLQLAREHSRIPVSREVMADLETPVAAFWKLRAGNASFLLESVAGGEAYARYTLLGSRPTRVFVAKGQDLTEHVFDDKGELTNTSIQRVTSHPLGPLGVLLDRYQGERIAPGIDEKGQPSTLPRFYGGLVGAISYDAIRYIEAIPNRHGSAATTPELIFIETRQLLAWDNLKQRAQWVEIVATEGLDEAALTQAWRDVQVRFDEAEQRLLGPLPPLPVSPSANPSLVETLDDDRFCELVKEAKDYIQAGDIIQVVLSRAFTQESQGLHPFLVYRTLRAINPSPYMFYLELPEVTLVGASPELLVRSTPDKATGTGKAEVRPIAGTRQRGADAGEDRTLADELKADPKEVAEHIMLVDLGRNDLGRIAPLRSFKDPEGPAVTVDELMVVERYSHVMHLVSHVSTTLAPGVTPSQVLAATFPAGTLSGAPKIRAMQLIDALEDQPRGFYGGAVGTLSMDGVLDLAIAIRTLMVEGQSFRVQAGAGVVWDSDPQSEADETRKKASAVLKAIDSARRLFAAPSRQGN